MGYLGPRFFSFCRGELPFALAVAIVFRSYELDVASVDEFQKIHIRSILCVRFEKSMRLIHYRVMKASCRRVERGWTGPGRDRPWSTGIPSSFG